MVLGTYVLKVPRGEARPWGCYFRGGGLTLRGEVVETACDCLSLTGRGVIFLTFKSCFEGPLEGIYDGESPEASY